jgi:hypothetical protein
MKFESIHDEIAFSHAMGEAQAQAFEEGVASVQKQTFHKYIKIFRFGHDDVKELLGNPGHIIIAQEKIDGANFRFMIRQGKILFGSRSMSLEENSKGWVRCIDFIKKALADKDLTPYEGYIFYGEFAAKHTLNYNWDKIPPFILFDVLNTEGIFEPATNYMHLGLPIVPIIMVREAHSVKVPTDEDVPISQYGDFKAEGLVYKNYTARPQVFAKYVRDQFKEENRKVFGGEKMTHTDDSWFVSTYATNARIDKQVFKFIDEGEELHMKLMAKLPKAVMEDIFAENWNEICSIKGRSINFDSIRKTLADRCREVLNQIITNNGQDIVTNRDLYNGTKN